MKAHCQLKKNQIYFYLLRFFDCLRWTIFLTNVNLKNHSWVGTHFVCKTKFWLIFVTILLYEVNNKLYDPLCCWTKPSKYIRLDYEISKWTCDYRQKCIMQCQIRIKTSNRSTRVNLKVYLRRIQKVWKNGLESTSIHLESYAKFGI